MPTKQALWARQNIRKGSRYRFQGSKYFDVCEEAAENPGEWIDCGVLFANQNSAGQQAWRFKNGFYGKHFDARTKGERVEICYVG